MDRNYDAITYFLKNLYFKKAWGSHFSWRHQNCDHVYQCLEELEIVYLNRIYKWISWHSKISWFPVKNADVGRTQWVCHVIYIVFGSSLGKV